MEGGSRHFVPSANKRRAQMKKGKYPSQVYRDWLRYGVRVLDLIPSVLMPGELVNNMWLADLEAAAELQGWDWKRQAQPYRCYTSSHSHHLVPSASKE
jgi:hypothetical protein